MLNLAAFEKDFTDIFKEILPAAVEQVMLMTLPGKSNAGDEIAKRCGETFTNLVAEPMAKRIAATIDAYIKSGAIKGTIITVGSPVTQTAVIAPVNLGNPTAGAVPNTLGIV